MKKIFFAALAAVALTACVADVVTEEPTYAIDFVSSAQGTVKSTVVTSVNLPSFQVFAFNGENVIMPNMTVTNTTSGWTYSPKKYWPLEGSVDFYGVYVEGLNAETAKDQAVNIDGKYAFTYEADTDGLSFTIDMDPEATGTKRVIDLDDVNAADIPDVVYASAIGKTKDNTNSPVLMTFRHAMAQVDFQMKNATTQADMITVESGDVYVVGLVADGTYTITRSSNGDKGAWAAIDPEADTYDYLFKGAPVTISTAKTEAILSSSEGANMAIPQATGVMFQVYCKIWQNEVLIFEGYKTASTSINWEEGKKYTYTFVIDADSIKDNEIKFTAAVTEIVNGTTPPVETPTTPAN